MMMMTHYLEQEYFPALEWAVLTLCFADGTSQELEYEAHGDPDLNGALAAVGSHFGLDELDMDVGTERRETDGRYAFHVYHPCQGLLARILYARNRF
ncbi:MAG TPA: hypothetical protein VK970_11070 [Candidatus Methylacidiphilales bacterium]|nr:hypothetical protein [Candidatus Methylacidiphilales bacterium]